MFELEWQQYNDTRIAPVKKGLVETSDFNCTFLEATGKILKLSCYKSSKNCFLKYLYIVWVSI